MARGDRSVYVKQRPRRLGGSLLPATSFSLPISKRSFPILLLRLENPEDGIFSTLRLPSERATSLNSRNSIFALESGRSSGKELYMPYSLDLNGAESIVRDDVQRETGLESRRRYPYSCDGFRIFSLRSK
ncbi:hypothetical protein NPIL_416811 [Nephila pilipes]|uniref:Uncharacterized protein n=1 Tax=Nephila pilipes TaxID=299642 RepID=A0A8X6MVY1_NEPPI|nr:hypothetical protein NPIL_416811 [Nephila pilipes]